MKSKIFIHGACDLYDILDTEIIKTNFVVVNQHWKFLDSSNASLDMQRMCFPGTGSTLRSIYTDPGKIALRAYESLIEKNNDEKLLAKTVFQEISKFPYFDFYKKHATDRDFLVVSFGSEVFSKCEVGNECFSCLPRMIDLANEEHPLHWVYKEYLSNADNIWSFDERNNQNQSSELMKQFVEDLYPIFKDRVILVKTHFTPKVRYNNSIIKINSFADNSIPFYKRSKLITDSRDINYMEKYIALAEKKFRTYYKSDVPYVEVNDDLYVDGNHRWGASQFHLDLLSRMKVANKIYAKIKEKLDKISDLNQAVL